jgi:hypothetical protein
MRVSEQSCISQVRVSHKGMHLAGYYRRMPLIDVSLRGVYLTGVHLIGVSPTLPTLRFKRSFPGKAPYPRTWYLNYPGA